MTNSEFNKAKEIASDLDRAASRASQIGARPASPKQCFFLAKLCVENGVSLDDLELSLDKTNAVLSSKRASVLINRLLGDEPVQKAAKVEEKPYTPPAIISDRKTVRKALRAFLVSDDFAKLAEVTNWKSYTETRVKALISEAGLAGMLPDFKSAKALILEIHNAERQSGRFA